MQVSAVELKVNEEFAGKVTASISDGLRARLIGLLIVIVRVVTAEQTWLPCCIVNPSNSNALAVKKSCDLRSISAAPELEPVATTT